MNKGLLVSIGSLFFISLFAFLLIFPLQSSFANAQDDLYQNGHQEGYQDAIDGIESLCATKRCKAKQPYERGYKLGYKKGIRNRKSFANAQDDVTLNKEFVRPLIDTPGKTIGSDFNGDGIHDFIVGAYGTSTKAGETYIFFGATSLSGTKDLGGVSSPDVSFVGKASGEKLGYSVASVGDVNGDGIHDIITGAQYNDDGTGTDAGAAYIFFGATNLSGTFDMGGGVQSPDVTILGKAGGDRLGISVSGAGDFNGDGFDDIIVGATKNADTFTSAGAAYIFFGATNLSGTFDLGGGQSADVSVLGKANGDNLGFSVSGAGDVNSDGFDDVIIGALTNNDGGSNNEGAAYIIFGATTPTATFDLSGVQSADVTMLGKRVVDLFGSGVSGAGDVNGDGFDDVIVGARQNDDGGGYGGTGENEGAAYIFYGASNLSGTKDTGSGDEDVAILGRGAGDQLGRLIQTISGVGDINDDGFDDIIVGAHLNDDGTGTDAGAAYIFFGASDLSGDKDLGGTASADVTVLGKAATDNLGLNVSGVGDVNGDGIPDFIVGAHGNNDGGSDDEGAAYVFFGATDLSGTKDLGGTASADITVLGKASNDYVGYSVGGGRSNPGQ